MRELNGLLLAAHMAVGSMVATLAVFLIAPALATAALTSTCLWTGAHLGRLNRAILDDGGCSRLSTFYQKHQLLQCSTDCPFS